MLGIRRVGILLDRRAKKSVLLVAPGFPPTNREASRRAAAFAKHLPALGWQVTVLTSQRSNEGDLMFSDEVKANCGTDESRFVRKLLPPSRPAPRAKVLGRLAGSADILCVPGAEIGIKPVRTGRCLEWTIARSVQT